MALVCIVSTYKVVSYVAQVIQFVPFSPNKFQELMKHVKHERRVRKRFLLDKKRHVARQVEANTGGKRGGLGKVDEVFDGECHRDALLQFNDGSIFLLATTFSDKSGRRETNTICYLRCQPCCLPSM